MNKTKFLFFTHFFNARLRGEEDEMDEVRNTDDEVEVGDCCQNRSFQGVA